STKQPMNVSYTRIVVDEEGKSHFSSGEIPMALGSYAQPEPKLRLSKTYPATSATFFSAPPGYFGDWHTAIRKQFLFHLSGVSEIVVSDGETRQFGPGDILLVEDTTGQGHTARVVGDEDIVIVAVPAALDE
ncbi:MAG: quercetin dioxygenase-like cupin family protein, partial [Gammaproteobacteria bacterium]